MKKNALIIESFTKKVFTIVTQKNTLDPVFKKTY